MAKFTLRFNPSQLHELAGRYDDPNEPVVERLAPIMKDMEYLDKDSFVNLMGWKTKRTKRRIASVDAVFLKDVTTLAFHPCDERLRIGVLRILDGVDWPSASVILHFKFPDRYPIIDFRALWSLGFDKPPTYNFAFWEEYSAYCRALARENKLTMRELDRALWQYSKENQPKATP